MLITWDDYNNIYLLGREPSILENEFPYWERRARSYVDAVTFARLHDDTVFETHREAVTLCVCELAEYYATDAVQESKGLTAHSVSGQSKSYDKRGLEEREIISRYLGDTGLLFAGV